MRYLDPSIEGVLSQTFSRWQWLRFLRQSATLATCVTGVVLLLGVGMVLGWFTSAAWMTACFVLLILGSAFAWIAMGFVTAFAPEDRSGLAGALERSHKLLMDRLNTLVFLQQADDHRLEPYADRIEQQTRGVLAGEPPSYPFSPRRALVQGSLFVVVLIATILFYGHFHPWQRVSAATGNTASTPEKEEPFLEIPPLEEPASQLPEEEAPWGEIRISEPGSDLRATTLDVVPLRIEAAANRPLKQVEWFTAVNREAETRHELPPPDDPRYAVYQPELLLQDHAVEAWDVLSYFARATTEDGQTYDSNVYFVEVVPFREELEEVPGGSEGPAYTLLEQLTAMIQRQQEVIRKTYRQERWTDQPADERKERLRGLAREEADLRHATQHVAADARSRFQESALDGLDDHFQRAGSTLNDAEGALFEEDLKEAGKHERAALDELVATRKQFQELLRQNPDAFEKPPDDLAAVGERDAPGESSDQHRQPAESTRLQQALERLADGQRQLETRQRRFQSAREFVQKTLSAERNLERAANPRNQEKHPELAAQQRQLNRSLEDFVKKNPQSFCRSQGACSGAQSAMSRAARSMQAKSPDARQDAGQAAEALQKLDDSLEEQQQANRLADAYRLKQMLDEKISQLAQCQQHGASPGQCQQLAQQAKSITGQLKQIGEQGPTSGAFGPPLRKALSDESKQQLDAKSDGLSQAAHPAEQQRAAGELRKGLENVCRAFDASRPSMLAPQQRGDPLRACGQEAIARGMRPLESAARRQAGGRPLSRQGQSRLGREALANLEAGVSTVYGYNERSREVIGKLRRRLEEPDAIIDLQTVRDLLREIEQLRREVAIDDEPQTDRAETVHIDPARLPPAYRRSIEKYFEKLSEK